jgi:formate/nitrite transporter FocA (FNT family)
MQLGSRHNIVVATASNLVGGSLMVGAAYWFVYLRRSSQASGLPTVTSPSA